MSKKFKVGDKVRCIDVQMKDGVSVIKLNSEYVVSGYSKLTSHCIKLEGWSGFSFDESRFELAPTPEEKRAELEAALDLIDQYDIRKHEVGEIRYYIGEAQGPVKRNALLDKLTPIETKEQKRIKEIDALIMELEAERADLSS